ncbi:MAG TPA: hypothetical protein VN231_13010 [Allosphingosinicella sp.]|nr:hypothetical protein [Allosphingosinicella sp.]
MSDERTDFDQLIPEIRLWNDGAGISAEGWIGCVGNYPLAVGYSLIFWPRFVRFEGYVLREGFSEGALRGFESGEGSSRASVERVMNHLHIGDIHFGEQAAEAQLRYLGRVLKEIYEVKLRADFPDLRFVVEFEDEPGLDPVDYQLSFRQAEEGE